MPAESGFTSEVMRYVAAEIHVHSLLAATVYVAKEHISSEGAAITLSVGIFVCTAALSAIRHHRRVKKERAEKATTAKDPAGIEPSDSPPPSL